LILEGEFGMWEIETPAGGVEEEAEPEITIKKFFGFHNYILHIFGHKVVAVVLEISMSLTHPYKTGL
jgi:hypothetical protein